MLPSDGYGEKVHAFLLNIVSERKNDEKISKLTIPEILRHILYCKDSYNEDLYRDLLKLLREIWAVDAEGLIRGADVKKKLDEVCGENSDLILFLEEYGEIKPHDLWFQLIWTTYRLRNKLWRTRDIKAPAFAKRNGNEMDDWIIEDIIAVLETWPLTNTSNVDFPNHLHYCALTLLQVLRVRRDDVLEADELLRKIRTLFSSSVEDDNDSMYGMYKYVDIPVAIALAEAINSVYTKQYEKTIELSMHAWSEASRLSLTNPMRVLFMGWAASTLTTVYIRCDLQSRVEESRMFYPKGILEKNKENPDWNDWCKNLRKEDFLPKVMYYGFEDGDEEDKGNWIETRGEAFAVYELITEVEKKTEEHPKKNTPYKEWENSIREDNSDLFQKYLHEMCNKKRERDGADSASEWDDYKIRTGLKAWLNDNPSLKGKTEIEKRIKNYDDLRGAGDGSYLRQLNMTKSRVCGNETDMLEELLENWKKEGVKGIEGIPGTKEDRKELIKKILEFSSSGPVIFKLFEGRGCLQDPHRSKELGNSPALPTNSTHEDNMGLLKGKPTRSQATTLFNYVSIQLTRLALSIPDGNKNIKIANTPKRSDILDIARLEFRFLWLVRLMTWRGVGEPSENMTKEEKNRLLYRDLPIKGATNVSPLQPSPSTWSKSTEKMKLLLDDYEENLLRIFHSQTSTSRPLLLLMARMLNYRWYQINQKKTPPDDEEKKELKEVKNRLEGILNRIMKELMNLHPIKLHSKWKYAEWFKRSCGPLEDGDENFKFNLGIGQSKSKNTSLRWLQEVSYFDVGPYVRHDQRGKRQALLLLHPRSFSNPKSQTFS